LAGVFGYVPQGLLGDSIQSGADIRRQLAGSIFLDKAGTHAGTLLEFGGKRAKGRRETEILNNGGVQPMRKAAQIFGEISGAFNQIVKAAAAWLVGEFGFAAKTVGVVRKQGQALADVVVEFARHAAAFRVAKRQYPGGV
jgi:hypothetical protein